MGIFDRNSTNTQRIYVEAGQHIDAVIRAGEKAMHDAMPTIGVEATNTVKVLLTHPPVSVPGEPPGLRTGGLRLSYNWQHDKETPSRSTLSVGSDRATVQPIKGRQVDYAKYLEYGTRKMAARPHLRPAMALVTPLIGPTLNAACQAAQRAAAATLRAT